MVVVTGMFPKKFTRFFEAPRCAISFAKKIASEPRFLLRIEWVKVVLAAEFPAIPSSAVKIASERRCAILVHSASPPYLDNPNLGDNAFGVFPLFLSLAITAFGAPGGYFSLAIIAFGAFRPIVPKYSYRLGRMDKRSLDSLI